MGVLTMFSTPIPVLRVTMSSIWARCSSVYFFHRNDDVGGFAGQVYDDIVEAFGFEGREFGCRLFFYEFRHFHHALDGALALGFGRLVLLMISFKGVFVLGTDLFAVDSGLGHVCRCPGKGQPLLVFL